VITPFRQIIHPGDNGKDVLAVKRGLIAMKAQDADRLVLQAPNGEIAGEGFVHCIMALRHNLGMQPGRDYGKELHQAVAKHFDAYGVKLYREAKIRKPTPHPKRHGQYGALVDASLVFAGADQGIDFTSAGNVYAIADMHVTRCVRRGSGWPGNPGSLLVCHLDGRPWSDEFGNFFYVAEDFDISLSLLAKFHIGRLFGLVGLQVGSAVKMGQKLGKANGKWVAPGIECGWADSSGQAIAHAHSSGPTPAGNNFNEHILQISR
jgi:hypothetical protein